MTSANSTLAPPGGRPVHAGTATDERTDVRPQSTCCGAATKMFHWVIRFLRGLSWMTGRTASGVNAAPYTTLHHIINYEVWGSKIGQATMRSNVTEWKESSSYSLSVVYIAAGVIPGEIWNELRAYACFGLTQPVFWYMHWRGSRVGRIAE